METQTTLQHLVLTVFDEHLQDLSVPASPEQIVVFQQLLGFMLVLTNHPAEFTTAETHSQQTSRFWYVKKKKKKKKGSRLWGAIAMWNLVLAKGNSCPVLHLHRYLFVDHLSSIPAEEYPAYAAGYGFVFPQLLDVLQIKHRYGHLRFGSPYALAS